MTFSKSINNTLLYIILSIICLISGHNFAFALDSSYYTIESKLASGNWVKIRVDESGIYAITESVARSWGFSDISNLKIFGYGGAPISTTLNSSQIDDLPQVPTYRANGTIYFYAQGPTTWTYSQSNAVQFVQNQHAYATAGYYFVSDRSDIEPLSVETVSTTLASTDSPVTTFTDRVYHEQELYSPGETGNYLLGEDFLYTSSRTFSFSIPGYVSGTNVNVLTTFAAAATGSTSSRLTFQYNGNTLTSTTSDAIGTITSDYYHCRLTSSTKQFTLTNNSFDYTISFSNTGSIVSMARLNYITVNYTRELAMTGNDFPFRYYGTSGTVLSLSGANSSTVIFDVTTANEPVIVSTTTVDSDLRFTPSATGLREYRAFDTSSSSFPSPVSAGSVTNQNLHGDSIPDMIIITPSEFETQAERVASLHESMDSMRVLVLTPEVIYNEFSSGTPDVMAYRKLAKMFYDRGTDTQGHKLQYLLLFGRSSYDNRQITSDVQNDSYPRLLQWENNVGDYDNSSYTTDDILVTLDDGTSESNMGDPRYGGMSIAVGRMPVKSVSEAKTVVDKLYSYVEGDYGSWKNNVLMVADDGDSGTHMKQSDAALECMRNNGGNDYVYTHVFLDAYNQVTDGSGNYYPDARKKMFQKLDEGVLMLHYIGHGNTVSWTHDGLLTYSDINSMYLNHYPLIYTATCEFSRVDANSVSGGELLYLNSRGGAIALFSTTRPTYISENEVMSTSFGNYLFKRDDQNRFLPIGEVIRQTKNAATYSSSTNNTNKLRYILIGDPAMRLAYPTYNVQLETINGEAVSDDNMPEFKARQTITLKGTVYTPSGEKATNFNGTIQPTLYDAEQSIVTKGNKASNEDDTIDPYVYYERSNRLAVVKDSIVNGEFSVRVTIPSEILYPESYENYSPALVNFYANSSDGLEANGSNEQFYIYGYDETVENDTIGPDITKFVLNTESFSDGDNVNESPLVIASFYDESGINLSTSGIGHQMTLLLDGTTLYSDVSTYYTPDVSDGTTMGGTINYPLEDLTAGNHTLRLKVWDTFSNSSEKTISFNVVTGLAPEIYDVYTTNSPAYTEANFYITHDRPDATITVRLSIYNLLGQEIWTTSETGKSDMFTSFPITWDLTDSGGSRVPRGIYLYRASISTDGEQETTKSKRIAVAGE